jgi:hypothetical protein
VGSRQPGEAYPGEFAEFNSLSSAGFVIGTIGSPEGVEYVKVTLEPTSDPPLTVRLPVKDARLLAKAIDTAFRSIEETRSATLRRPLPGWDEQG